MKAESLINAVKENVQEGSIMVTVENTSYTGLRANYQHARVNHSQKKYVIGAAHTNTLEGFWNLLKKQINGIHHSVSPKHLQRYCNEASYRYNRKNEAQDIRFTETLANCEGRLKYNDLIK